MLGLAYVFYSLILLARNTTEPTDTDGVDTTSHNFTFQTWTFGEHSSSTLYDVAILDENNIWAVGEIYLNDSLGQPDPNAHNAAYWNGHDWELKMIKTNACGGVTYPPIKAIIAFSEDDILFAHIDGSITHYDGIDFTNDCSLITQLNDSANKIWGISKNDYYIVSGNGFIAHYNGQSWMRIESGTELNIYDIYGQKKTNGEFEIICVAADVAVSTKKNIFKIINNTVQDLPTAGIPSSLKGIWFKPGKKYYVVGSGMFTKTDINSSNGWLAIWQGLTESYTGSIDGNDLNDIVVCGSYGEMLHYNGNNWKSFKSEL